MYGKMDQFDDYQLAKEYAQAEFDSYDGPKNSEYWKVGRYNNNKTQLQDLLDILYNMDEGKKMHIYEVEEMEYQSSCRLIIKCIVCNVNSLSSYQMLTSHNGGANHNRRITQSKSTDNPNKGPVCFKSKKDFQPYNCFKKDTLEYKLDQTCFKVIGAHMLYSEKYENKFYYTCRLCNAYDYRHYIAMNKDEAFDHIIDREPHIYNYMKIKFGYRAFSEDDMDKYEKRIQDREGRLTSTIALVEKGNIELTLADKKGFFKTEVKPIVCKNEAKAVTDSPLSVESFSDQLDILKNVVSKRPSSHPLVLHLVEDADAIVLISVFVNIMAEKLDIFGSTIASEFKHYVKKLLEETKKLNTLPLD